MTEEEYKLQVAVLDQSHIQNETARDAFIGLAHTALFAASVSFVGDVTPLSEAVWKPALLLSWASSVAGLLALTASFSAARRYLNACRAKINNPERPSPWFIDTLTFVSLWSFPASLLSLFLFVSINVWSAHDSTTSAAAAAVIPAHRATRDHAATASTAVHPDNFGGREAAPSGTSVRSAGTAAVSAEEVAAAGAR